MTLTVVVDGFLFFCEKEKKSNDKNTSECHQSTIMNCWIPQSTRNLFGSCWMWWTELPFSFFLPLIISIHVILEGSRHFQALKVVYWWNCKRQQIQWLHEKWHQAFRVARAAEALNCNRWLWKTDDSEESLKNKPLRRCATLDNWIWPGCNFKIEKAIMLRARGNYGCLVINTRNIANWHRSFWSIYDQNSDAENWRSIAAEK